jgi:hypothetical protein
MKIYLETKDKDNHRIVFEANNGKLVYSGEWTRRKATARETLHCSLYDLGLRDVRLAAAMHGVTERPYKPGAFAKNSGPAKKKAVKSTTKKKK